MPSIGSIVTRIYTSQARLPIQGATVAFTQSAPDGRQTLLAARVSDANGQTSPVRLATPDPAEGVSPGGETPYTLCTIWTEAPGYEYSVLPGVQVFPDTVTVQDILLTPLSLSPQEQGPTDVPQDL